MKRPSFGFTFLAILIVWLPLQSFLAALFAGPFGMPSRWAFWLAHWYEPMLLAVLAVQAAFLARKRRRLSGPETAAVAYLVCVGVAALFSRETLSFTMQGIRYLALPAALFLLASWSRLREGEGQSLKRAYLGLALGVAAWAVVERALPVSYWHAWLPGFPADWGWGNFLVGNAQRSVSLLGGPNQLAAFLLPAVFLVAEGWHGKGAVRRRWAFLAEMLLVIVIFLAMSRAAWIGLGVASPYLVWVTWPFARTRRRAVAGYIVAVVVLLAAYFARGAVSDLLTHGASQRDHAASLSHALGELLRRVSGDSRAVAFGSGPGTAGPLNQYYGIAFMPESWYLQVILEAGALALAAWLGFVSLLGRLLVRHEAFGLAVALGALSVTAAFLHTFADAPGAVAALCILAGVRARMPDNDKAGIVAL